MIDRIEKIDFFAVLPAGVYTFVILFVNYKALLEPNVFLNKSIWFPILSLAKGVGTKPVLLALILFVCYLLGSSLRALPVNLVESFIPPFRVKFPYSDNLKKVLETLAMSPSMTGFDPQKPPIIKKILILRSSIIGRTHFVLKNQTRSHSTKPLKRELVSLQECSGQVVLASWEVPSLLSKNVLQSYLTGTYLLSSLYY